MKVAASTRQLPHIDDQSLESCSAHFSRTVEIAHRPQKRGDNQRTTCTVISGSRDSRAIGMSAIGM
jgi:hypothetical protein